jgi:hypothetical protein
VRGQAPAASPSHCSMRRVVARLLHCRGRVDTWGPWNVSVGVFPAGFGCRRSSLLTPRSVPPVKPGVFGVAMPPAYARNPSAPVEVLVEDLPSMKAAVMHRPQALNAMNTSMVERLTELYTRCVQRPLPSASGTALRAQSPALLW